MSASTALAALTATIPASTGGDNATPQPVGAPLGGAPQTNSEPKPTLDSSRLALFAKKEAEIVKNREQYKAEQAALKADRDAFEAERVRVKDLETKFQKFQDIKSTDAYAALKALDFSDTDIVNLIAGTQDTSSPEEKARKIVTTELDKYKQEQAKIEADNQNKRNKNIVNNFKQDISRQVTGDPKTYEYINHYGSVGEQLVYDTVEEVFKNSGELISPKEAADMVESYYEAEAERLLTKEKLKAKLAASVPKEVPKPSPVVEKPQPAKTLTSKTVATTASTTVYKKESPGEKKARLIAKLANLGKA